MKIPSKAPRGFTLLEVLLSLMLTLIIMIALVSVVGTAMDSWRDSRNEIRATRQAKAAIEMINRDLEGLVVRSGNPFQWLSISAEPTPPGPGTSSSSNAAKIAFFTAATDRYDGEDGLGDVSTAIYELTYQDPISGQDDFPTFVLYRRLINPDETFEELLTLEELSDSAIYQQGAAVDLENFICENIYQFTITFLVQESHDVGTTPPIQRYVVQSGGEFNSFKVHGNRLVVNGEEVDGRLRGIEVSLTIISEPAVEMIKASVPSAQLAEFLAQHSYQFSKSIEIPQP